MSLEAPAQDKNAKQLEKKRTETTTYHLESDAPTVELIWTHVAARESSERVPGRAVILLSGWGNTRLASMQDLPQAFADSTHSETYTMIPRTEERGQKSAGEDTNFLYEEARAIAQFIKDKEIKEVTLAGHSMGADRAIDVAAILQHDPEIKVNGLVLLGPVGLHEKDPVDLAKTFVAHTAGVPFIAPGVPQIPKEVKNSSAKDAPYIHGLAKDEAARRSPTEKTAAEIAKAGTWDGILSQVAEVGRSWGPGVSFWRRLSSDIADMAIKNPRMETVNVPIVLIAGSNDPVADHEKIMPTEEEQKIRKEMEEKPEQRKVLAAREQYLQENLFKNSPYVRMIVPEKMGNHLVQIFRPEAVAKVSMYLLDRYNREKSREAPIA